MNPILLFLVAFLTLCKTKSVDKNLTLPSYIQVCHQKDPNLNECIKKAVEKMKPMLVKGIPDLDVPSLEPLHISEIVLDHGSGGVALKSMYTDIQVYGPSQFQLKSVKVDMKKDRVRIKLFLPHLHVISQYSMEGRILMMPISGKGESSGNYSDIDVTVTMQGQRIQKDGVEYFNIKDFYVDFVLGHVTLQLNNLFNGDKTLGDAMNTFINENWQNVVKEIKPVLEDTIAGVCKKMANKIFSKFSLDKILPE